MEKTTEGGSCLGVIVILLLNAFLGGWSVNYLLDVFLGKMIPFWGACLIGLFAGEVTFPFAVVTMLLKYFHVI